MVERIIYLREKKKIVLNVKEKYLILSDLSELNSDIEINIRHFRLLEV